MHTHTHTGVQHDYTIPASRHTGFKHVLLFVSQSVTVWFYTIHLYTRLIHFCKDNGSCSKPHGLELPAVVDGMQMV